MKTALVAAFTLVVSACGTFIPTRYSVSPDTTIALRATGATSVGIGPIADPPRFDKTCRDAGPVQMPDGLTIGSYIQRALADEMKVAGLFAANNARVTLSGSVTKADFSSSVTGSYWDVAVVLKSSNGNEITVSHRYDFGGSWDWRAACPNVANAFMPTVQTLIQKAVSSADFMELLK